MTQKEMISDFQNYKDLVLKLYQELNIIDLLYFLMHQGVDVLKRTEKIVNI